jgi:thioredoxin-like negative regulator of GroEL
MKQMFNSFSIVDLQNYKSEIIDEKRLVLLVCLHHNERLKEQLEVLEDILNNYNTVLKICIINKDHKKAVMKHFKINGTPTYLIFKDGKEKDRILGDLDYTTLTSFIQEHLPD